MWCLSVKCHFVNGLYIQTSLAVNCLPATSDRYYHTYAQEWWSGIYKEKKKMYFHIWEVLSHSRECGSRAAFLGGSRMIREGSHVWLIAFQQQSDSYYHTYALEWWSGKSKKKNKSFFLCFHIREVLSHSRECGSRAAFPGGSRMIREGSHVFQLLPGHSMPK